MPILPFKDGFFMTLSGFLILLAAPLYYNTISKELPSRVVFYIQLIPIFVLIFSAVFLGQLPSFVQVIGFFTILVSIVILSVEFKKSTFTFSKPIIYIILFDVLMALSFISSKIAVEANTFPKIISYECFGSGLAGFAILLFSSNYRKAFIHLVKNANKSTLGILSINEIIYLVARAFGFFAIYLGPVALASVVMSIQAFYGIALGVLLTMLFPKIFHEEIDKKTVLKQVICFIILFIGLILIQK
jgi:drug/metabolite transporter (DMT)-like permease